MEDLAVTYGRIRQEPRFERDGTTVTEIIVPIFLGKHGPFTERFSEADWSNPLAVAARVDALKQTLRTLPS
jgi:hypothetical protein